MSTFIKMALAIFTGGFIGALVATEIAIMYCWIGFLLGGVVSWIVYARNEIWKVLASSCKEVIERIETKTLPSLGNFFLLTLAFVMVTLSWEFIPLLLHPESAKSLLELALWTGIVGSLFLLGMDTVCAVMVKGEKPLIDHFILSMLFKLNFVFVVGNIIWYSLRWGPVILLFLLQEAWKVFKSCHNREAQICNVCGCIGAIFGFIFAKSTGVHLGGALIGALIGVAIGWLDYHFLWPQMNSRCLSATS